MSDFSKNETIALMHENLADALRDIANHIEKWKYDWKDTVQWLREISDQQDAQSIVVKLRDNL